MAFITMRFVDFGGAAAFAAFIALGFTAALFGGAAAFVAIIVFIAIADQCQLMTVGLEESG